MHLDRGWEARRIVYTKDELCIAFVGEETVRDMIPLAEILNVEELGSDFGKEFSSSASGDTSLSNTVNPCSFLFGARSASNSKHVATTIKLITKEKGYNSGRTYYLQPETQALPHLMRELTKLSDVARKKAEGKTRFQNSQARADSHCR